MRFTDWASPLLGVAVMASCSVLRAAMAMPTPIVAVDNPVAVRKILLFAQGPNNGQKRKALYCPTLTLSENERTNERTPPAIRRIQGKFFFVRLLFHCFFPSLPPPSYCYCYHSGRSPVLDTHPHTHSLSLSLDADVAYSRSL